MENIITLIAALGGAIVGGCFAFCTALAIQKRQEKERYFYEFYGKRIELYQQIMMFISETSDSLNTDYPDTVEKTFQQMSMRFMNRAYVLFVQSHIYASKEVREACSVFFEFIFELFQGKVDSESSEDIARFRDGIRLVNDAILAEAPAEEISNFIKKITKTKKTCTNNHSNKKSN